MRSIVLTIMCTIFMVSCTDESNLSETNPRIKEALEKRKTMYRKEVMENCKRDMVEKATLFVDSLIAAEISYQLSDSIVFPPKPVKPTSPGPIIIKDTVKAQPVW